jgi:spermidine synthase
VVRALDRRLREATAPAGTPMTTTLTAVFFLSGAAALLFETLWFRQTGLMLGNSVWASSLVTASFMAGLALGNFFAGRRGGALRRPVRAYALLEVVIAVTGLGLVLLLPRLTPFLAPALRAASNQPVLLNLLRLALAFVLMLIPATAMGATLPLLVRALSARQADFGRAMGSLYGWNTIGAVAGALGGEMVLVQALGMRGTALAAAGLNLLAALGAAFVVRGTVDPVSEPAPRPAGPGTRWLLGAALLAGGILLALEVVWFRFLLLFVFGTSRTFAILLALVLVGIGAGSLLATAWLRWQPRAHRFAPIVALLSVVLTARGYFALGDDLGAATLLSMGASLMLPTSVASGLLFAFLGKSVRERMNGDARAAGAFVLANTVGAAAGALTGGFLLLPRLGIERSFWLLSAGYVVVAAAALRARRGDGPLPRRESQVLVAAALLGAAVLGFFPFGLMKTRYIPYPASKYEEDARIVAVREGLTETVISLEYRLWDEPTYRRILSNAVSMSGTIPECRRYMGFFVYWPLAVHPQTRHALVICYGVGATAKALTDNPSLETIEIVDLSRDILELGHLLWAPRNPLDDPRVRVHVEDGRHYLLTTDRRYDLITGEPPPPKAAGIVSLYTREYFELVRERLHEGGIATYWLPVYQLEPRDAKAITAAFCDAFSDCSLWSGFGTEWVLAGTRGARGGASEEDFTRQWRNPEILQELVDVAIETPEQLGAMFLADAPRLREWSRGVPPLDDDHPQRLSHRFPEGIQESYLAFADPAKARAGFEASDLVRRLWPPALRERTLASFLDLGVVEGYGWHKRSGTPAPGLPELHALLTRTRLRTPVQWFLGGGSLELQIAARAAARGLTDPGIDHVRGAGALADRDYRRAAELFRSAQRRSPAPENDAPLLVLALAMAGQKAEAVAVMREASGWRRPKDVESWRWLSRTFDLPDPYPSAAAAPSPSVPSRP